MKIALNTEIHTTRTWRSTATRRSRSLEYGQKVAAVPDSIPDPSPPGRRHFPGRDHVSERDRPITVRLIAAGWLACSMFE